MIPQHASSYTYPLKKLVQENYSKHIFHNLVDTLDLFFLRGWVMIFHNLSTLLIHFHVS